VKTIAINFLRRDEVRKVHDTLQNRLVSN